MNYNAHADSADSSRPSILVADDDERLRTQLARALAARGYEVCVAANHEEALSIAKAESPEMAVVDLRMPGASGLELVRELKTIDPSTHVLMLTGYGSIATAVEAMRLGACHYLPKPADADDILVAFGKAGTTSNDSAAHEAAVPSLERVKWEHINRVLADSDGNISEAARKLHMHRRTLQRMLQKYPPQR